MRTRSPRNHAANATVISGAANEIAVASTSGSRASAAKLRNMPHMLIVPRREMAERALGAHDVGKLAPPGVDQQHRHDREGGAKEHHLAERHRLSPR